MSCQVPAGGPSSPARRSIVRRLTRRRQWRASAAGGSGAGLTVATTVLLATDFVSRRVQNFQHDSYLGAIVDLIQLRRPRDP
jgi:hypothetical protein